MRIIKKPELEVTCGHCTSIIGIMPHEFNVVSPPGPYDMDYEPEEIGKKYWNCPVCKFRNWMKSSSDNDPYC